MIFKKKKRRISLQKKEKIISLLEMEKGTSMKLMLPETISLLNINQEWKSILINEDVDEKLKGVYKLWDNLGNCLPKTICSMKKYLIDVDLILKTDRFIVFYYFIMNDKFHYYEGNLPKTDYDNSALNIKDLPETLQFFYCNIHNGFFNNEFGLISFEKIDALKDKKDYVFNADKDLSKFYPVFQNGLGDYIGYDMLNEKPVSLLLFHDEVNDVNVDYDFWDLVDVWLNMKFEL